MNHIALNRAGPDNRNLDRQIVKRARLQARQHVDLRPALDLEDTDTVSPAQHVVYRRIA